MNKSFTAIVPLFNKGGTITRALRSIALQTLPVDEVIVVDDGSTDAGPASVESFIKLNAGVPVRMLTQRNRGVSAARNVGAQVAKTSYIAFLDADDEWLPGHIALLTNLLEHYPNASLLSCAHVLADKRPAFVRKNSGAKITLCRPLEFGPLYAKGRHILNSSSAAVARQDFLDGPKFPEGAVRGEDIYHWLRFSLDHCVALRSDVTVRIHKTGVPKQRQVVPPYFLVWFSDNWHRLSEDERRSVKGFLRRSAIRASISAGLKGNANVLVKIIELLGPVDRSTTTLLTIVRKTLFRWI